jgi:DNA-binding transcriptional LysR family regulator
LHFKQLEAFVSVVQTHSFSRAAEKLGLTQPTISAHINSLEKELETQLIVRSTKEVYPSDAGALFYEYALEVLDTRDRAVYAIRSGGDLLSGSISIAASTIPAQYVLPQLITSFVLRYPDTLFTVRQCDSEQVVDQLISREADLGMTGTIIENTKCIYEPVAKDRLCIIAPNTPHFSQFAPDAFPLELLKTEPIILREMGSGTRRETEPFLISCGVDPKALQVAAYMDSTEGIKQAVACGLGISILSERAVQDLRENQRILCFFPRSEYLVRKLYLVRHTERPLHPMAELFIKHMKTGGSFPGRKE